MIRKIENISKQIEDQIQIKELEVSNIIRDVPPIILILERGFVEMKSLVLSENFKTNSDEIHFFKETKPKLFSKFIYKHQRYWINRRYPLVFIYMAIISKKNIKFNIRKLIAFSFYKRTIH